MPMIEVDPMSIDQLAGAVVLFLGSVGSLLLVVWQSKCHCKVNLCYIFQCERRPPNEEEMKTLAEETKTLRNKSENVMKKVSSKPKTSEGPPTLSVEPQSESPEPERLIPPKEDIDKLV
jgi:hypothetical protein